MQFAKYIFAALILAATAARAEPPVTATIETTLGTDAEQIRQFAFDGDDETFFASSANAGPADHFTLVFDQPAAVQSIAVVTGGKDGSGRLEAGLLQVSADGKTFETAAKFVDGMTKVDLPGRQVRAIRIAPEEELKHSLAIREIAIASQPAVSVFRYPVEFLVDAGEAPELQAWADRAAKVCQRAYPMINEELKSEGFRPPRVVRLAIKRDYRGVAATSGDRIVASADYFKHHLDDVGALVHETAHVVQHYTGRRNPSWLVEGVADYVRFFKFEPGNLGAIDPERARHDGSYRVSAAFLAYLAEKYDQEIVRKLNQRMRDGQYEESAFQELAGKSLAELGAEWRASLKPAD